MVGVEYSYVYMTPGDEPLRRQGPEVGGAQFPRQGRGEGPPSSPSDAPPQAPPAPGETGGAGADDQGAGRAEADRIRKNEQANQELITGVITNLPRTERVDDYSVGDAIAIGRYPRRSRAGRAVARVIIDKTFWKQETSRDQFGERHDLKRAGPRWKIGETTKGVPPGTKDFLIAERGIDDKIKLRIIRVNAAAYDNARLLGWAQLRLGLGRQHKRLYDRDRGVARVTMLSHGVVRICVEHSDNLRPTLQDVRQRRLPANPVGTELWPTDKDMERFGVHEHLWGIMYHLGMEWRYDQLKAIYDGKWRAPSGQTA